MTTVREGKALIAATREFAQENAGLSWAYLLSTIAVWAVFLSATIWFEPWYLKLFASILMGLTSVRWFILYHDHLHGALLRNSRGAKFIFRFLGYYVMAPPKVWRETHNFHHAHTARPAKSHVGSYPLYTVEMWHNLSSTERFRYRLTRHPLTILAGYFSVFAWGMCASSFLRNPSKNWTSLMALLLHGVAAFLIFNFFGASALLFSYFLPVATSQALGGYLFYAQHNAPDVELRPAESWSYTHAATMGSTYMKMGPVMAWFTGNIGYHQVHHLNPTIPFYRLPEAMAAIPELQNSPETSLSFKDTVACFRANLWDPKKQAMVNYPKAGRDATGLSTGIEKQSPREAA